MSSDDLPAVFFQMLRSFVTLGATQNLSKAVEILGTSRHSIRRHVAELERRVGEGLFDNTGRQYKLTTRGKLLAEDAEYLLNRSKACINNRSGRALNLLSTETFIDDKSWMYAQQHPLNNVWTEAPPILQRGLEAWTAGRGELESAAFDKVRPYMLVYRKYRNEWLIVEVGTKSAYATWLGISTAKSELGRGLDLGEKYAPLVESWRKPYDATLGNGSLWYEHISVSAPRELGGPPTPVNYQRLVTACKFPDGEPATAVFAARTDRSNIPEMPVKLFSKNQPENLMEFDI